jgi:hypothetical protein
MGSLTVSLTPSLNPKMTLTKFLRHVTRRVSVYFFILSSTLFLYFIFIFVYILSVEPVYIDHDMFVLNFFFQYEHIVDVHCFFFCPTLQFSRRLFVTKKIHRTFPHEVAW